MMASPGGLRGRRSMVHLISVTDIKQVGSNQCQCVDESVDAQQRGVGGKGAKTEAPLQLYDGGFRDPLEYAEDSFLSRWQKKIDNLGTKQECARNDD